MLFITGVPHGYFGVELSFGARTGRVFTSEGPVFHWPWINVELISQAMLTSKRTLKYRTAYGTTVKVRYSVQFRASPDICDSEGRNKFSEWSGSESGLRKIKDYIEQTLDIDFGWICRHASAEDLVVSSEPLELMGRCLLKLNTPPHEDELFTSKIIHDVDLLQFYARNRERILEIHKTSRLRPILSLFPGGANSGRYVGEPLDANGRIANPQFHQQLSPVEQLLGIEILDLEVAVDSSPLFLVNGEVILG